MMDVKDIKNYVNELAKELFSNLEADEVLGCSFHGESSHFVRFNHAKVRQAIHVLQNKVSLEYQAKNKRASLTCELAFNRDQDIWKVRESLLQVRDETRQTPEDPLLIPLKNNGQHEQFFQGDIPPVEQQIDDILESSQQLDFVGFLQTGSVYRASINSLGQSHWFSCDTFDLEFSLFDPQERAAKGQYSGSSWDREQLKTKINSTHTSLKLLDLPVQKIKPGNYRTYLAPAAVAELLEHVGWKGLSLYAHKTSKAPFQSLIDQNSHLSKKLSITENFDLGLGPRFNSQGEISPDRLEIFDQGALKSLLVSSRTAKEFSVAGNFAESGEEPRSLELKSGQLAESKILSSLDTGLYLSNLHYLAWSDLGSGRITGMTRFACFWVEKGEIKGPIENLRFDVSLHDIWGDNLIDFTQNTEIASELSTYESRSLGGIKCPGALINDFSYTL